MLIQGSLEHGEDLEDCLFAPRVQHCDVRSDRSQKLPAVKGEMQRDVVIIIRPDPSDIDLPV